MILFEWRAIQVWHSLYNSWNRGLASDEEWNQILWIFENIGRRQSVREAWKRYKGGFTHEFQELLDSYLESDRGDDGVPND